MWCRTRILLPRTPLPWHWPMTPTYIYGSLPQKWGTRSLSTTIIDLHTRLWVHFSKSTIQATMGWTMTTKWDIYTPRAKETQGPLPVKCSTHGAWTMLLFYNRDRRDTTGTRPESNRRDRSSPYRSRSLYHYHTSGEMVVSTFVSVRHGGINIWFNIWFRCWYHHGVVVHGSGPKRATPVTSVRFHSCASRISVVPIRGRLP